MTSQKYKESENTEITEFVTKVKTVQTIIVKCNMKKVLWKAEG